MKRLMAVTLMLSLLDVTGALAEDDHRGGGGHAAPPPHEQAPHGAAPAPQGRPGPAPGPRSGPFAYVPQGQADRPHAETGAPPPAARPPTHLGHGGFGAPGFQPGGADRPRYTPQNFPHQVRPNQRFHWSGGHDWAPQPGFYARHWAYGDYLPDGWFASSFWITNWGDYDLPVPPYGYEWVRVGPDALLVDTYTGEVVSTVYGLFY